MVKCLIQPHRLVLTGQLIRDVFFSLFLSFFVFLAYCVSCVFRVPICFHSNDGTIRNGVCSQLTHGEIGTHAQARSRCGIWESGNGSPLFPKRVLSTGHSVITSQPFGSEKVSLSLILFRPFCPLQPSAPSLEAVQVVTAEGEPMSARGSTVVPALFVRSSRGQGFPSPARGAWEKHNESTHTSVVV